MAIFRKVHTSFWSDTFTSELDQNKKLFYLYLLTNERTKQCGIYEISKRQISFDLGINTDTVSKQLKFFSDSGKIMYNETTKELAMKNWGKYNNSTSPKLQSCVSKELTEVKDTLLIDYVRGIYTLSQQEQEQEQEEEQDSIPKATKIKNFLMWFNNSKKIHLGKEGLTGQLSSTDINNLFKLRKCYGQNQFDSAFKNMCKSNWASENNMIVPAHFLRNDNFDKYLNQESDVKAINPQFG